MSADIDYKNNPLHGVSVKQVLVELVDHYGFDILFAYLQINCFNVNPSIESSVKFLKKTAWAREKVEAFYLYKYKNLPRASDEQFALPPRDRVIPADQSPGEPAVLSLEAAARLHEQRSRKNAERSQSMGRPGSAQRHTKPRGSVYSNVRHTGAPRRDESASAESPPTPAASFPDPWGKWRK